MSSDRLRVPGLSGVPIRVAISIGLTCGSVGPGVVKTPWQLEARVQLHSSRDFYVIFLVWQLVASAAALRRLRTQFEKIVVDVQAAIPSS